MSLTSPERTPPWIAAPIATTLSGSISLLGSFPKIFLALSWTAGILVEPPTRRILAIWLIERPESLRALSTDSLHLSTRSAVISWNFCLVSSKSRCFGPVASAAINGRFIFVDVSEDKIIFACSAASLSLCIATRSVLKSMP